LTVTEEPGLDEALSDVRLGSVLDVLNRLDGAHISYDLKHTRPDSLMADIAVPGWRWEVEFMSDGSLEIERFRSVAGVETDPSLLERVRGVAPTRRKLCGASKAVGRLGLFLRERRRR
jgi:hypothetical protein